jgi:hypothetical protein
MELRHDACRNESRNRHYGRWQPFSDEMSYNPRGAEMPWSPRPSGDDGLAETNFPRPAEKSRKMPG